MVGGEGGKRARYTERTNAHVVDFKHNMCSSSRSLHPRSLSSASSLFLLLLVSFRFQSAMYTFLPSKNPRGQLQNFPEITILAWIYHRKLIFYNQLLDSPESHFFSEKLFFYWKLFKHIIFIIFIFTLAWMQTCTQIPDPRPPRHCQVRAQ